MKIPGLYSWGFNDHVCPPTSMYSAFNVIEASKGLMLNYDTRHWIYPEQQEKTDDSLCERLVK